MEILLGALVGSIERAAGTYLSAAGLVVEWLWFLEHLWAPLLSGGEYGDTFVQEHGSGEAQGHLV